MSTFISSFDLRESNFKWLHLVIQVPSQNANIDVKNYQSISKINTLSLPLFLFFGCENIFGLKKEVFFHGLIVLCLMQIFSMKAQGH